MAVDLNDKRFEGKSYREVIKIVARVQANAFGISPNDLSIKDKLSNIDFSNPDYYAYKDSNGRWRAGRLSRTPTGRFVSSGSARSLRGVATKNETKKLEALKIVTQSDLDIENYDEALNLANKVLTRYRKAVKENPDVRKEQLYSESRRFYKTELPES